jgi:hypothetical protein
MTDEVGERRAARQRTRDARFAVLNAAIDARAPALVPHGPAIIELLHAAGLYWDLMQEGRHDRRDQHPAQLVKVIAAVLGVSPAQSMEILNRLNSGGDD